ncbi:MAG: OmpP1/FadL family transporter [Francisellaceae bacterium]
MSTSFASAYQIFEQDAASLGTYHAGSAASANSAATEWYNPAGMVELKQQELSIGGELVHTNIIYNGTQTNNSNIIATTTESAHINGGGWTPVPNIHYVLPFDKWAFGIGVVAPFGAETDYGDSTALRYSGTKTQLQTVDLTPAIAFKVNKFLSVGIGADIVYATGEFDNVFLYYDDLDFNTGDYSVTNKGDGFNYGYHAGILFKLNENNHFGITYHSQINVNLKGTTTVGGNTSFLQKYFPNVQDGDNFSTKMILPAWWDLSYYSQITENFAVMASAIYTEWDSVSSTELKNVADPVSGGYGDITIEQHFKNSWNFALGATYDVTPKWQLKAGVGYDQTPTVDEYRNIYIPDQDRYIVATGVAYKIMPLMTLSLNYAHFFVRNASINVTQPMFVTEQTTNGNVNSDADLIGLQMDWKF